MVVPVRGEAAHQTEVRAPQLNPADARIAAVALERVAVGNGHMQRAGGAAMPERPPQERVAVGGGHAPSGAITGERVVVGGGHAPSRGGAERVAVGGGHTPTPTRGITGERARVGGGHNQL